MTGKDLILYILQNDLENTEVFQDGFFIGFMSAGEAAVKFGVGMATIESWYIRGMVNGIRIGDSLYLLKDVADPRITQ